MDALRERVEQFEQVNRDYLAAMTGATHQQQQLMIRAKSAMQGVVQNRNVEEFKVAERVTASFLGESENSNDQLA